jgi:hypothetical protein
MTSIQPKKRASISAPPDTNVYLSLKLASCSKAGQRASGKIDYRLLTNSERGELFLTIVDNDGAGYFSREIVAFSKIEHCLATVPADKPFPAKVLQPAFSGRSVNNAGFLLAVLKAEGLLIPVPDKVHLHRRSTKDWPQWQQELLKQNGEPFQPESKAERQTLSGSQQEAADAQRKEGEEGKKVGRESQRRKANGQSTEPVAISDQTTAESELAEQENTSMLTASNNITFEDHADDTLAVLLKEPRHLPDTKHQHPTLGDDHAATS